MDIQYEFVPYGTECDPRPGVIVLDVGMRTEPGVIDHHHSGAEPECTASLIVKHPELILDHFPTIAPEINASQKRSLKIVTHRLPDFDALASIFLALRLLETRRVDSAMQRIAAYTKLADSASLPVELDLAATPYSILRALFSGAKKEEAVINRERVDEGGKFMRFLYEKCLEGYEIEENRSLFSGVDRYERAMRKVEEDYFHYLDDAARSQAVDLRLPRTDMPGRLQLDGLVVRNPSCFLLKEWARRDRSGSPHHSGFGLTLTNFGNLRYIIGVDPFRNVHLKGLGSRLNAREKEKRDALGRPLLYRWYEGDCPFFNYRIVDSPQDGTVLSHQEIVLELLEFAEGRVF